MSIESVLKTWITDNTGITNVIQQPFSGDRQTEPSIGFQVLSFDYSDFDTSNRTSKDDTFVEYDFRNNATMLLSVSSYGSKAYEVLNKLKFSLNSWAARNLLATENMSLNRVDSVTNVAAFESTTFRQQWNCNFEFNIILSDILDIHKINQWVLHGVWTDNIGDEFLVSTNNEFLVSSDNEFLVSSDAVTDIQSTINYP